MNRSDSIKLTQKSRFSHTHTATKSCYNLAEPMEIFKRVIIQLQLSCLTFDAD